MLNSAYIAAALTLLLVALSLNVTRLRLAHRISFGDGGIKPLTVAMRAHGNSLEQALLFIVLLYLAEASHGIDARTTIAMGIAFLLARLSYCTALFRRILLLRQASHVATLLLQTGAALAILWP